MVKEGYKQTEIGIIPKDWDIKSYDDLFNFLSTATYSRADLSNEDSIQYLHYGDIHTKYHFVLDFDKSMLPTIPNELLKKYPLLQDGDIIMADASEDYEGICKSVEVKNIKGKKVISGLHTFLLRDKNNIFINGFKAYLSSNKLIRKQFNSQATGMKVFGVSKANLKNILIPIPPRDEQMRISKVLTDIDELIVSFEKLILKKEAIKKGSMTELLTGRKRLPDFSEDWEKKRLEDLVIFINGKAHESHISEFGKYIVINSKFVSTGGVVKKYSNEILQNVEKDDVVMVMSDVPNGKAIAKCFYIDKNNVYTLNQRICLLRAIKIDSKFLFYIINRHKYYLSFDDGSKQTNLKRQDILNCFLNIPSNTKEQKAIAQILTNIDNDIELLKIKLLKIKHIKDGMVSKLLTGNTRLKV